MTNRAGAVAGIMGAVGLSNVFRRVELARARWHLIRGDTLSELELLRMSFESSHRHRMNDTLHSDLSDLLGLTRLESTTRVNKNTLSVSRVAQDADILAEVRRLLAQQPNRDSDQPQ
jgi:hypothetical protein